VQKRGGVPDASSGLFPHLSVVIAYRLLFGVYSGIVPDGIDDLAVDDIDWAGDATILLSYVKGRTAAESLTLPKKAVRLAGAVAGPLDVAARPRRDGSGPRVVAWCHQAGQLGGVQRADRPQCRQGVGGPARSDR
jgi:hypothetical protein